MDSVTYSLLFFMENLFLVHPWVLVLILLWTLPWKGAALWRAARRGHLGWFLTLIILNTLAILDIIYIFFFSGPLGEEKQPNQDEVRQVRMQRYREQQNKAKILEGQVAQQQEIEARQASAASKRRLTIL